MVKERKDRDLPYLERILKKLLYMKYVMNTIGNGKYPYKTMMGRKDKNSHTGRMPSTAAVFPHWITTAALCIRK